MNPLRIIILIILFYILFRLLIAGKTRRAGQGRKVRLNAHDVLVEDPVCRTFIPKKQAVTLKHNGKTIYFCSTECRDKHQAYKGE